MTTAQAEAALTNETLASWKRTRSANELSCFVLGRVVAFQESVDGADVDDELLEDF